MLLQGMLLRLALKPRVSVLSIAPAPGQTKHLRMRGCWPFRLQASAAWQWWLCYHAVVFKQLCLKHSSTCGDIWVSDLGDAMPFDEWFIWVLNR